MVRIALVIMFPAHGLYLRVLVFGTPGTVHFFELLNYPALFACAMISGSIIIRLLLSGALLVHLPNSLLLRAQDDGRKFPAFLIIAAATRCLLGNSALAPNLPPRSSLLGRAL